MEAREEKEEAFGVGGEAKGLVGWEFGVVEEEKGFWVELAEVGKVELKRLLPRFEGEWSFLDDSWDGAPLHDVLGIPAAVCETLMPLMALIVPSFFRHAFRLQLNM